MHTTYRRLRNILNWVQDEALRRLFLNSGKLLSASGIAAIAGLLITALSARALGVENFGTLALVLAYVQVIGRLVSFNAWQVIIKFGSELLEDEGSADINQLMIFGFSLDLGSALLGTILAILLSGVTVSLLNWNEEIRSLLSIYSLLLLFNWTGTPVGILRLFNRFDLLSYGQIFSASVKLIGIVCCYISSQTLTGFIIAYLIAGIIGQAFPIVGSLHVLRANKIGNLISRPRGKLQSKFPGIWNFVWTTNISSTIKMASREIDIFIIASLTSPSSVGLFKVAKEFSRILPTLGDPLYQAIYPELARLWARNEKRQFVNLMKRATIVVTSIAVSAWLGFILFGEWIITITVGSEYLGAFVPALLYMLALVIALAAFSLPPAMLAMGLPTESLKAISYGTIVYLIFLPFLVVNLGIAGASISYISFYVVWSIVMSARLRTTLLPQGGFA